MDDLHHCAALVGAARSEVFDDVDIWRRGQRAVCFVGGCAAEVVEAVGKNADLDASPVDAQSTFVQRLLNLCRSGAA